MVLMIFLGNSNRKVHGGLGFIRSHTSVRVARRGGQNVLERPDLGNGVYMELESGIGNWRVDDVILPKSI